MNSSNIPPALTGQSLLDAMGKSKERRLALAEGLLYEQTINMIAADPGTGKSTIASQVAVELAAGLPVFGIYHVPKPLRVLYIQTERSILELLERLDIINKHIPIIASNLFVTDEYQGFNLLNADNAKLFIECVQRDCPNADIIFIDPIYCMVSGGLKEDLPASAFTKAMSNLQKATKATLWYNHHTVKTTYNNKGEAVEKADPFYGSQWIKAHVTGSFHLKECEGGVKLVLKKDNYQILPNSITLEYDPETGLCSVPLSDSPPLERIRAFIKRRELDKKTFTFKDILTETKLSERCARQFLMHNSIKDRLFVVSSKAHKHLYSVQTPSEGSALHEHTI